MLVYYNPSNHLIYTIYDGHSDGASTVEPFLKYINDLSEKYKNDFDCYMITTD